MRPWILLTFLVLTGCDNTTLPAAPGFSLFETSAGVVYLVNQTNGDLKVISSKHTVILNNGDVFEDGDGKIFTYLGDGKIELTGHRDRNSG